MWFSVLCCGLGNGVSVLFGMREFRVRDESRSGGG